MKTKRTFLSILTLCIALLFTACSGKETASTKSTNTKAESGSKSADDSNSKLDDLYQQENQIFADHEDVWNKVFGITKSISPVPVTENGSLTYTFLIQNEGNVPANEATAVIVTDTFNPILSNLTVTFNGSTWTEGEDYTYDKTTGTFATGAGKVTVPAATFTVNETTGEWSSNPGFSTLTITGTV